MSEKYIDIQHLDFKYANKLIFDNLSLQLYNKNCYVVAGLNGCGKSTLLKILAGKTICEYDKVKVLGKDPFRDTCLNNHIAYINNDWGNQTVAYTGYNVPLQSSLLVKDMMMNLKKEFPERDKELIRVLGINPEWRLNAVSEGQRKRVQLYLNLIKPFKICLLDEITVNLDLLVKDNFMTYLKKETEQRDCCIVYVTHIFDGLEEWATKLIYMKSYQELEISDASTIPNFYKYLLNNFNKDYIIHDENEEKDININMHNAGGYSDGVMNNFIS
jgi:CCR4-NOT complex subunit CAF16